jgi:hypothetical protein
VAATAGTNLRYNGVADVIASGGDDTAQQEGPTRRPARSRDLPRMTLCAIGTDRSGKLGFAHIGARGNLGAAQWCSSALTFASGIAG